MANKKSFNTPAKSNNQMAEVACPHRVKYLAEVWLKYSKYLTRVKSEPTLTLKGQRGSQESVISSLGSVFGDEWHKVEKLDR